MDNELISKVNHTRPLNSSNQQLIHFQTISYTILHTIYYRKISKPHFKEDGMSTVIV